MRGWKLWDICFLAAGLGWLALVLWALSLAPHGEPVFAPGLLPIVEKDRGIGV
jgi:hypothetical protein